MATRTISRICKSHKKHFIGDLRGAGGLDEQKLHRARVQIKDLRVLLDLLNQVTEGKKNGKVIEKQLGPLFQLAGEIRRTMLSLKLCKPYRSRVLIRFRQQLRNKQQETGEKFLKKLKSFDVKQFKKHHEKALDHLSRLKEKKIRKGAEEYLRVLFAHIRADVFDINDDETLHQIRKRLKSIRNVGNILNEIDPEHPFVEDLIKVNRTYDKIGNWHDTLDLVESLEKYVEELDDPVALERTAPLILALKKSCLLKKRQIEKRLKVDLVM